MLAVASATGDTQPAVIGLVGLDDPPRHDSGALLASLRALGVRPVMVTGDSAATAAAIASRVGLGDRIATPASLDKQTPAETLDIYAEVFPEDKYRLIKAVQQSGHVVAMCGDGVNDAPALRHAQAGIAVSSATDVARKAAAIVLTKTGLDGIAAALTEGRCAFERLTTYALNALEKKFQLVLFLAVGMLMTGHALLTPMLMALLLTTGDFITMALTTDNVRPSEMPVPWNMRRLTGFAAVIGLAQLLFNVGVTAVAHFRYGMPVEQMRSLSFAVLVFSSQSSVYAIRERNPKRLWHVVPGRWLVAPSVLDIAAACALTTGGILMARLPVIDVLALLGAAVVFSLPLLAINLILFSRAGIGAPQQAQFVAAGPVARGQCASRRQS